jgi:hypothetical protein
MYGNMCLIEQNQVGLCVFKAAENESKFAILLRKKHK